MIPVQERFEQWVDYTWEYSDTPVYCKVNLELEENAPYDNLPFLCTIKIIVANNNDLSSLLQTVNQIATSFFKDKDNLLYAGTYFTPAEISIALYCAKDANIQELIATLQLKMSNCELHYSFTEDSDWEFYLETLYPTPIQMQSIINKQFLQALEEQYPYINADNKIYHWVLFNKIKELEEFKKNITEENYEVELQIFDDKTVHFPHKLKFSRIDNLSLQNINKITHNLFKLAESLDGEYDGWEI